MLEYFGPVQRLALAPLVWIVLFPALGASLLVFFLVRARLDGDPKAKPVAPRTLAQIAAGSVALGLAALVYDVTLLAQQAREARELYTPLVRVVRIGQLDVHIALSLDPIAAVAAGVVALVGTLLLAREALARSPSASPRALVAACAFVTGMQLLFLADGFGLFLVGSQIAGAAALVLVGPTRRTRFVVERAGEVLILFGAAALFWGLGGTWSDGDYASDLNPRYVAVSSLGVAEGHVAMPEHHASPVDDEDEDDKPQVAHVVGSVMGKGATPPTTGRGYLTLASTPGAIVYLDDARTPLADGPDPDRAPIVRRAIPGGVHTFRVHPGGGSDDYLVTHAPAGADADLTLVLVGGSFQFRDVADQMVLENARGERFLRDAFRGRHLFGMSLPVLLSLLFAVGALLRSGLALPGADAEEAPRLAGPLVASSGAALPGVYLLARLAPVLGFDLASGVVVATLVALVAVVLGVVARAPRGPHQVTAALGGALGAIAITAAVGGHPVAGLGMAAGASLALVVRAVVPELPLLATTSTRLGIAQVLCLVVIVVATAAGLPGLEAAGSVPRIVPAVLVALAGALVTEALVRGLRQGARATQGEPAPSTQTTLRKGQVGAKKARAKEQAKGAASAGAVAVSGRVAPAHGPSSIAAAVVCTAALLVVTVGLALGAVVSDLGWLAAWLRPALRDAPPAFLPSASSYAAGAIALALAVVAGARAKPEPAAPGWLADRFDDGFGVGGMVDRLARLVVELDKRVLDGIVDAGGLLTRAAAWVGARFDRDLVDAPPHAVTEGVLETAGRPLDAVAQGRGERALFLALLALPLAALLLLLLSSR